MGGVDPMTWTAEKIIEATGGELLCGNLHQRFSKVSIDSREIAPQDLFVAIIGDVHDGHTFTNQVVEQGVSGLVVNRSRIEGLPFETWQASNLSCIAVEDTTTALGDIAAFNRRRSAVSVVAITGSNGKTTTRELTNAIVTREFHTLSTLGNYNNQIGVPLTLLNLESKHELAVVELGTNYPGEIARLAEICSPDIGVITNIGPAHLEGLGSIEGIMREKGDLLKKLKPGGHSVLNADDSRVKQMARKTKSNVVLFGLSPDADIRADEIREINGAIIFSLIHPDERVSIKLNSPARFMIINALAASAVGYVLGISSANIKAGLEAFTPVTGRMNILRLPNEITLMDDTYNANPSSMKSAISTLATLRSTSRSALVAGDMLELGPQAEILHREIGAIAVRSGIQRIYAQGEFAEAVAAGARDEGLKPTNIFTGAREEILHDLKQWLQPGDWLLVKGSRGMAMEKIVKELKDWAVLNVGNA
jgi:UDP-N-acetylmuramoyl-tripeptide--D-alanyl-D-alanine ligase